LAISKPLSQGPLPQEGRTAAPLALADKRRGAFRDLALVFAAVVFPIHIWSIINLLDEVPAWMLRLSLGELIGVIAYTQLFALIESILVAAVLVGIRQLLVAAGRLPKLVGLRRLIAEKYVSLAAVFIFVNSIWAGLIQIYYETLRLWSAAQFLPWALLFLLSNLLLLGLVARFSRADRIVRLLVERLAVLSYLYVALDVVCLFIVLARNL
jgi:hypothetical protein